MADAGYLTIGKVVKKLQPQYPDLSVSKVRFLEDEGLLNPQRTSGGYRLYSQRDVDRLETILHLQKTRFLPLAVIKDELERMEAGQSSVASQESPQGRAVLEEFPAEMTERLHAIDRIPELINVSVSFVRQLSDVGIISFKRSPHGRDLVDGRDFALIRACDELRKFGILPKNLRLYVRAADNESMMFEQALVVYSTKGGGVELDQTDENREKRDAAFSRMLDLTNAVRSSLIRQRVRDPFKNAE